MTDRGEGSLSILCSCDRWLTNLVKSGWNVSECVCVCVCRALVSFLFDWIIHFVLHTYKIKPTFRADNQVDVCLAPQIIDFRPQTETCKCVKHLPAHCVWLISRLIFTTLQERFWKTYFSRKRLCQAVLVLQIQTRPHLMWTVTVVTVGNMMPEPAACLTASVPHSQNTDVMVDYAVDNAQNEIFTYTVIKENIQYIICRLELTFTVLGQLGFWRLFMLAKCQNSEII